MYVYNFSTVKGDTYPATEVFQILKNNVPFDLTDCILKSYFRRGNAISPVMLQMDTDNNNLLIITDEVNGKFKFAEQIINLPEGQYVYDLQITTLTGKIHTYLKGTMTVLQDITY